MNEEKEPWESVLRLAETWAAVKTEQTGGLSPEMGDDLITFRGEHYPSFERGGG